MRAWVLGCAVAACSHPAKPLAPAGSPADDGDGELAHASKQLLTQGPKAPARVTAAPGGAGAFGGGTYASYRFPPWGGEAWEPMRTTRDLPGAVAGTVSFATKPRRTGCGDVARGAGGVLVVVDHVDWGRELPEIGGRAGVGGEVFVRGCAFWPELQIAAPRPAVLTIDAGTAAVAVHVASGSIITDVAVGAGGRTRIDLSEPLTKISASDAAIAPAWIVVPRSPYYAITDDAGRYRIDQLPAGELHVTFWRPGDDAPISVERVVRIPAARGVVTRLDAALH
ncbi:MAG TPA: carboxypeptidase-like regulatory domain-containing protein [Kofleriaceae bacterium]|jgi:hypothetical protein